MMSTPLARQELVISGTADADSAPLGGSIYSVDTGDVRNLTAVEAQMLYQAAQQDVAEGRVISDILSDTGYSPLQVDITGNDWDCVLNLDNFTDDAHTLELVNPHRYRVRSLPATGALLRAEDEGEQIDRKSTRLNSSH